MRPWTNIILMVCLCAGTGTLAHANTANEYLSLSKELEQLVAEATPDRSTVRLSNKKVAELISTLLASQHVLESTTYQIENLGTLMDICGSANAVVMSYMLFDLKNSVNPKTDPTPVAHQVQKVMENNLLAFQEELGQLQPFLLRCMAKQIPLMTAFMKSLKPEELTNIRLAGLQQHRDGVFSVYFGFLQNINNPSLEESYRAKILQTLAETATEYSSVLKPTARQQIIALANSVGLKTSNVFHRYLDAIIKAMTESACNGICIL